MAETNALFISSESFRGHSYGRNHPLSIPRVPLTLDLINAYRSLGTEAYLEARPASHGELCWFHDNAYVTALQECEQKGRVDGESRRRFNLGNFENPYFEKIFTIPALAAGGSIQGAEQVLAGKIAFNPAGGMHHALPHKARGFCYVNDAVLGILRLRQAGYRILYFDMDAHHGDGVQQGMDSDPKVLTASFHMDTAYAYPRKGGGVGDVGATRTAVNLPLPKDLNDSEYRFAFEAIWPELLNHFEPDAVVLQTGTDILHQDPLGKFGLSNRLFFDIVARIKDSCPRNTEGAPRLLVIGGGGYHPIALARCWTGVWNVLADWDLPDALPEAGRKLLRHIGYQIENETSQDESLYHGRLDARREGPVRRVIRRCVDLLLNSHPLFNGSAPQ